MVHPVQSMGLSWSSIVPLIVAILGLGTALATGYLTGRRQAGLERKKEVRLAIAELIRYMGQAIHEISWFTWKARFRESLLSKTDVEEYDKKMSAVFPELTGSLAVVAALSQDAYIVLKEMVDKIYGIDRKIAQAATTILLDQPNIPAVAAIYDEALILEGALHQRVADVSTSIR